MPAAPEHWYGHHAVLTRCDTPGCTVHMDGNTTCGKQACPVCGGGNPAHTRRVDGTTWHGCQECGTEWTT